MAMPKPIAVIHIEMVNPKPKKCKHLRAGRAQTAKRPKRQATDAIPPMVAPMATSWSNMMMQWLSSADHFWSWGLPSISSLLTLRALNWLRWYSATKKQMARPMHRLVRCKMATTVLFHGFFFALAAGILKLERRCCLDYTAVAIQNCREFRVGKQNLSRYCAWKKIDKWTRRGRRQKLWWNKFDDNLSNNTTNFTFHHHTTTATTNKMKLAEWMAT